MSRQRTIERLVLAAALASAAVIAGGCGSDPVSARPLTVADLAGTYVLTVWRGRLSPFPPVAGDSVFIAADTTTFRADSTWSETLVYGLIGSSATTTYRLSYPYWYVDASAGELVKLEHGNGSAANVFYTHFQIHDRGRTLTYPDRYGEQVYTRLP